jgi:signal transduction histidine kinase
MPEGGTIIIKTGITKEKKRVMMEFDDNGIGIEKENLVKIYDPFFTTKNPGEGTGLGLSVSSGIIEKYRGNIEVKSKPRKGTNFKIYLPAVKSDAM